MRKWIVWSTHHKFPGVWPAERTGIVGLLVQIASGQWFWFEAKFYGFLDGLPEGRQDPEGMSDVRFGVQVADAEMERVRAEAESESGLELLKS